MELDFLGDEPAQEKKVSSGNSQPLQPVQADHNMVKTMSYDQLKADLTYRQQFSEECPFINRAIEHVGELGFRVVDTIQEALTKRANGEQVLTLREADIVLRNNGVWPNVKFVLTAMRITNSLLTEDDSAFTRGVFQVRARYNMGLKWYREKYPTAVEKQKQDGMNRLRMLITMLINLQLPPHHEEVDVGFHKELLKPEWMNWTQFNIAMASVTRMESIHHKETRLEQEAIAMESIAAH